MKPNLGRAHRAAPVSLGVITMGSVVVLLARDIRPELFPFKSHGHPVAAEMFKAWLLSIAFLFWAANQFWSEAAGATLYNDLAIALFVLDVSFMMVGWPTGSPHESFAESYPK